MGEQTKIQWCDHTFNPWIGCAKVSPGCANCYAAVDTPARVARAQGEELWGRLASRRVTSDANWRKPPAWDREALAAGERRRVFCASQSDWLEDREDLVAPRARLLELVEATPNLDWLLLTKRPEGYYARMREITGEWHLPAHYPLPNAWIGASVEDQSRADVRIPALIAIPAAIRFLSVEPLLGPVDLSPWLGQDTIRWVIVGGESGPAARPCNLYWIRDVLDQCRAAGVACFVKQLGARIFFDATRGTRYDDHTYYKSSDTKGGDPDEWPGDLRVREFPSVAAGPA
jgi:protein gp37